MCFIQKCNVCLQCMSQYKSKAILYSITASSKRGGWLKPNLFVFPDTSRLTLLSVGPLTSFLPPHRPVSRDTADNTADGACFRFRPVSLALFISYVTVSVISEAKDTCPSNPKPPLSWDLNYPAFCHKIDPEICLNVWNTQMQHFLWIKGRIELSDLNPNLQDQKSLDPIWDTHFLD